MSQTALAKALGMSQAAMSDRLTGKTPFTLDELQALADTFGVDPADLLAGPSPRRVGVNSHERSRRAQARHARRRERRGLSLAGFGMPSPIRLVTSGN
jgi:transcriptional regulator with XRE-family HTH domain